MGGRAARNRCASSLAPPSPYGDPQGEEGKAGRPPHHFPFCLRRKAVRVRLHPPAALLVEFSERDVDGAFVLHRPALDHRPVGLVDLAVLEQQAEMRQRLAMAAEYQAAGGILVEPVRQRWRPRQAVAQRVEIVLERTAALRPAMHGNAAAACLPPASAHRGKAPAQSSLPVSCVNRYHGGGMNDNTPQIFVAAPHRRAQAHLVRHRRRDCPISSRSASCDAATLEDLEDILIRADLGVDVAARVTDAIRADRFDKEISADEVKAVLSDEVEKILGPVAKPLAIDTAHKPFVILVVGVNGSGKTTTIGKLAARLRAEGKSVALAAGDTFRAAAIGQLKIWSERTGADFFGSSQGSDAASLAFRRSGRDAR